MPRGDALGEGGTEVGAGRNASAATPSAPQEGVPPTPQGAVVIRGDPRKEKKAFEALVSALGCALREAQKTAGAVVLCFRFEDGGERSFTYLPPLELEVTDVAALALLADAFASLLPRPIVEARVEVTEGW